MGFGLRVEGLRFKVRLQFLGPVRHLRYWNVRFAMFNEKY